MSETTLEETSETQTSDIDVSPTSVQRTWLARGVDQPGGKLPLFDRNGQRVSNRTVKSCLDHGWAEPWFTNPVKPDWLVCKLTDAGRKLVKKR
jgi:hypothetical protein